MMHPAAPIFALLRWWFATVKTANPAAKPIPSIAAMSVSLRIRPVVLHDYAPPEATLRFFWAVVGRMLP
jgi:hypothetical protein